MPAKWGAAILTLGLCHAGGWAQGIKFQAPVMYPAQNGALASVTADFNGDGKPDLAVGNAGSSSISIFLGKGDGTFTAATVIPLPGGCAVSYLAAPDFNADGKPDLLAVCGFQGSLWAILGLGKGQFANPQQTQLAQPLIFFQGFLVEAAVQGIAVGDFTGDRKPDIVAIVGGPDISSSQTLGNPYVELFAGNGDATFQPPTTILNDPAIAYFGVAAGDLNRDGKLDLLVSEGQTSNQDLTSTALAVLLGDGRGGFHTAATYNTRDLVLGLAIGDFNGDGIPDLVHGGPVLHSGTQNSLTSTIAVLQGAGDGTFQPGFSVDENGALIYSLQLGDFRGTGKLDVAEIALTRSPSLALEIRANNGDGTFQAPSNLAGPGGQVAWWSGMVSGDWNGDGLLDLAVPIINSSAIQSIPQSISGVAELVAFYQHLPAGSLAVMLNGLPPHNPGTGTGTTGPVITSVVNAASFLPGIEAGSWVTIKGTNLANTNPGRTWRSSEIVNGNLPTALDNVSVTIDGRPAYVYYISPTQINVQAPSDATVGTVNVVVTTNGTSSAAFAAGMQAFAPALFLYSGTTFAIASRYPDYVLLGDPSTIAGTVPAKPGDVLILWATGFGATNPPTPAGIAVTGAPSTAAAPTVMVGGVAAQVLGAALAPGTAGLYQIAIQLPQNVPAGKAAVQATVGGVPSPAGISLFISAQ
ncbi:MAG: VCBS repeat-containing protein [Acidobacteriota bacterium]|nr:VCBS repeat-containing protein [Acidobacteriota bacterium]